MMDGAHHSTQDPTSGHSANVPHDDDTIVTPTRGDKARVTNSLFVEKPSGFDFQHWTPRRPCRSIYASCPLGAVWNPAGVW
jgi:hypothetical protein